MARARRKRKKLEDLNLVSSRSRSNEIFFVRTFTVRKMMSGSVIGLNSSNAC